MVKRKILGASGAPCNPIKIPPRGMNYTELLSPPADRCLLCSSSNLIFSQDRTRDTVKADTSEPVKLDAAAQAHIEKHRKLQDNLTDEMVGLA
ncbi:hypothetical protein Q3G72_014116 [Acer saccharum]|nr:hypothetical protein Q3G72_014116 [Acer saccharum]